ncbi:hypothetical protein R3P38DRAFT_3205798 [Favolaschia claudopus]|uniref:Uncharacterized protein n=1 Tax=Favolaschia claudopus TaxID=2862362 RepID=A0AAW0AP36_9AGAR
MSIFSATAVEQQPQTNKKQDILLACVTTTGCVNLIAAYMRRNMCEDTWFGQVFTVVLLADSVLNVTTAMRIVKRCYYEENVEGEVLPRYMPDVKCALVQDVEVSEKSGFNVATTVM